MKAEHIIFLDFKHILFDFCSHRLPSTGKIQTKYAPTPQQLILSGYSIAL